MENIEQLKYKGKLIEIKYDEDPEDPRNWDNLGTMYCVHSKYKLGDEHDLSIDEIQEYVARKDVIALPLHLYDHGGITMNIGGYSCPWDSRQVGFITITLDKIREEFKVKRVSKQLRNKIIEYLTSEVSTYDNYLTGQVYGYDVEGESCWGYYSIEDAMSEAKSIIDWNVKEELKKHLNKLKAQIKNRVPLNKRISYVGT